MSEVILDTITGKSTATTITIGSTPVVSASANSMTIRGEGSNQTSIQQGLCKFFSQIEGEGTISTRDSFNQSSISDNGTGDYDFAFTTSMGNDDYAQMSNADSASGHIAMQYSQGEQHTTGCRIFCTEIHANNSTDSDVIMVTVHGDLA